MHILVKISIKVTTALILFFLSSKIFPPIFNSFILKQKQKNENIQKEALIIANKELRPNRKDTNIIKIEKKKKMNKWINEKFLKEMNYKVTLQFSLWEKKFCYVTLGVHICVSLKLFYWFMVWLFFTKIKQWRVEVFYRYSCIIFRLLYFYDPG